MTNLKLSYKNTKPFNNFSFFKSNKPVVTNITAKLNGKILYKVKLSSKKENLS